MAYHVPTFSRLPYAEYMQIIRDSGYEAEQCPVCHLVCVSQKGLDPILEGLAQDTLETNIDSPRYKEMLGQQDHELCPDKILEIA
jgi:hypothetical protein